MGQRKDNVVRLPVAEEGARRAGASSAGGAAASRHPPENKDAGVLSAPASGQRAAGSPKTSKPTKETGHVGTWRGGYVRQDQRGRRVFYISKRIGGRRYEVSTRCDREDAAEQHYARFLDDPEAYAPTPVDVPEVEKALILDVDLARKFLDWSKSKGNTEEWVACQRQQLAWWSERWGDTNLRVEGGDEDKRRWLKVHVQKHLEGTKGKQQRVAVLSTLFTWLRKVALEVSPSTDPTFGMLARPAPYKPSKTKEAISEERFKEIRAQLEEGPYLWAFDVLMGTGRHLREVRTFAAAGPDAVGPLPKGRPLPREGKPKATAVLAFPDTKAGVPAWIAVSAAVEKSARKLLAWGEVPRGQFARGWELAVQAACVAADLRAGRVATEHLDAEGRLTPEGLKAARKQGQVKVFLLGWARRTVRTYAGNKGASGPECDDFLGHAKRTGEKHYGRHVPLKVPTMV